MAVIERVGLEPISSPVQAAATNANRSSAPSPSGRPAAARRIALWADAHRWRIFGVMAMFYLLGFNGQWRPEPDSALYLTVGRNLAQGQGYTYHGQPHHLVFPGLPLLFAGLFRVFGTSHFLPATMTMLLIGVASLALTYRLFLLHSGRPTAVVVTALVGFSRTFFRYNYELLSDLPFLMFVLAFLVGYESVVHRRMKSRRIVEPPPVEEDARAKPHPLDWALLAVGLAGLVVTRPAMFAVLLAVAGTMLWSMIRGRFRVGGLIVLAAAVAVGFAFYKFDPRGGSGGYEQALLNPENLRRVIHRALAENLWKIFHPTVAEAVFGLDLGKSVNPEVSLILLCVIFTLFRVHVLWGLLAAATLLMMGVEVHVRYLLFVLPLLMYACWRALEGLCRVWPSVAGRRAVVALVTLLLTTNIVRTIGFTMEQRAIPFWDRYKAGKYASLPQLAEMVRRTTEPGSWILVQHKLGRILTFTSGRYAVEPDASTRLDPQLQSVYALEPLTSKEQDGLDARTQEWVDAQGYVLGPALGQTQGQFDRQPWVLRRVLKRGANGA